MNSLDVPVSIPFPWIEGWVGRTLKGMFEPYQHTQHERARVQHLLHKSGLLWIDHETECTRLEVHERGNHHLLKGIPLFCSSRASCGLIAQKPFSESITRVPGEFKKWFPVKSLELNPRTGFVFKRTMWGHVGVSLQSSVSRSVTATRQLSFV